MKWFFHVVFSFAALMLMHAAIAGHVQFSADTYQKSPKGKEQRGKMYVGKDFVRTETQPGAEQIISIVSHSSGKQTLLFPGRKSYTVNDSGKRFKHDDLQKEFNPCSGLPGARCERLGDTSLSGREAVQWRVSLGQQDSDRTMLQWIDKKRGIPLRSELSGGQRMEMRMLGQEILGGRSVEKWESVMITAGQEKERSSFQWYDPGLNLVIREELPGGFVRELSNIRVSPQPDVLFQIPAGWVKVGDSSPVTGK